MPRLSLTFLVAFGVASCAPIPAHNGQTTTGDPIRDYRRSRAPLYPPSPPTEFGFVSGNDLVLTFNATMYAAQSRQHCDKKPVGIIPETPMQRQQRLLAEQRRRAARPVFMHRLEQLTGLNAPSEPPPQYRTIDDCYPIEPPSEVVGRFRLFAVAPTFQPEQPTTPAQLIEEITLSRDQTVRISLAGRVSTEQCLVIVDAGGKPVSVRWDGERYKFVTAARQHVQEVAKEEGQVGYLESELRASRKELQTLLADFQSQPARQGNQCVRPAMRPLPARPENLMPEDQLDLQAKGWCTEILRRNVGNQNIESALLMRGLDNYVEAARAGRKSGFAQCAREYIPSEGELQALQFAFNTPILSDITMLQQQVAMANQTLQRCEANVRNSCNARGRAWQAEVDRIRYEPESLYNRCASIVSRANEIQAKIPALEQKLAAARAAVAQTAQSGPDTSQRIPLSQAVCKL